MSKTEESARALHAVYVQGHGLEMLEVTDGEELRRPLTWDDIGPWQQNVWISVATAAAELCARAYGAP